MDFAGDDCAGEFCFDLLLEEAFEGSCSVDRVVALFADPVFGCVVELDFDSSVVETFV